MQKLIILDRDGVINFDSDEYIKSPEEWHPIPGSLSAIAELKKAGYHIAVASNQAGIALGLYTEETLARIHEKMQAALAELGAKIDVIFYCPHHKHDGCACRKPKPGLLQKAAAYFNRPLSGVLFIGDKKSDIEAAQAAGCVPVLLKTGYGTQTLEKHPELNQVKVYDNLAAAVKDLLQGA